MLEVDDGEQLLIGRVVDAGATSRAVDGTRRESPSHIQANQSV
jgi:hypothetical protein